MLRWHLCDILSPVSSNFQCKVTAIFSFRQQSHFRSWENRSISCPAMRETSTW